MSETAETADRVAVALALGSAQHAITVSIAAELRSQAQVASDEARARYASTDPGRARDAEHDGAFWVIDALRARADELDPPAPAPQRPEPARPEED